MNGGASHFYQCTADNVGISFHSSTCFNLLHTHHNKQMKSIVLDPGERMLIGWKRSSLSLSQGEVERGINELNVTKSALD